MNEVEAVGMSDDLKVRGEVDIEEIILREPFILEFSLEGDVYDQISESMRKRGYDRDFPVFLWAQDEKFVIFDGHRRVVAAKSCGLRKVPAVIYPSGYFNGDDHVLAYMRYIQYGRRNLSAAKKFCDMLALYTVDGFASLPAVEKPNRLRDRVSRYYGMSPATAARWIKVIKEGDIYHEQIINGALTPQAAFQEIKKFETVLAKEKQEAEDMEKRLDEPAGDEGGLSEGTSPEPTSVVVPEEFALEGERDSDWEAPIEHVRLLDLFRALHRHFISLGSKSADQDIERFMVALGQVGIEGVDVSLMQNIYAVVVTYMEV